MPRSGTALLEQGLTDSAHGKTRQRMLIAIVSTLISSVALLGVAISLFLQARQLRASQIQTARASQMELMRSALEHPDLVAETAWSGICPWWRAHANGGSRLSRHMATT
jgi:hypothetical protein